MLIITDENVHELYHKAVKEAFETWGMVTATAVVPPGRSLQSLQQAEELYTKALEAGLDRHSLIAALGGGVMGDLAGFTASTICGNSFHTDSYIPAGPGGQQHWRQGCR